VQHIRFASVYKIHYGGCRRIGSGWWRVWLAGRAARRSVLVFA